MLDECDAFIYFKLIQIDIHLPHSENTMLGCAY